MRKDKKKEKKSSLAVPGSLNSAGEFLANYVRSAKSKHLALSGHSYRLILM